MVQTITFYDTFNTPCPDRLVQFPAATIPHTWVVIYGEIISNQPFVGILTDKAKLHWHQL